MSKHTPGLEAVNPHFYADPPWYRTRVFKDHAHCYIATIYNDATREGTGIAQVISTTESECDANTRLMAAVHDLLAALESIAEHGDEGSRAVAQEAIAKAEEGS